MKPIARKDDLVIQETNGEILVYDLRTDKAICLNQTSALVWQNCDGKQDALEIAGNLERTLGAPVKEELVWFALSQLKEEGLLANKEGFSNNFKGLSRREVVRKIGLTSAVAIPVIASLIAPIAAQAQTCVPGGTCTCTTPGTAGNICTATPTGACMGTFAGCQCAHENNGNTMGVCVP